MMTSRWLYIVASHDAAVAMVNFGDAIYIISWSGSDIANFFEREFQRDPGLLMT